MSFGKSDGNSFGNYSNVIVADEVLPTYSRGDFYDAFKQKKNQTNIIPYVVKYLDNTNIRICYEYEER